MLSAHVAIRLVGEFTGAWTKLCVSCQRITELRLSLTAVLTMFDKGRKSGLGLARAAFRIGLGLL